MSVCYKQFVTCVGFSILLTNVFITTNLTFVMASSTPCRQMPVFPSASVAVQYLLIIVGLVLSSIVAFNTVIDCRLFTSVWVSFCPLLPWGTVCGETWHPQWSEPASSRSPVWAPHPPPLSQKQLAQQVSCCLLPLLSPPLGVSVAQTVNTVQREEHNKSTCS